MKLLRFLGLFGIVVVVSVADVSAQDAPPPNVDAILKEIEALEQKQLQGKNAQQRAIYAQIQAAAASPSAAGNFFSKATEEVNFAGKKDAVQGYIAWKKSHADLLRSREMQTALMLHLRYLMLAMQRKDMEKPETQLPAIMQYVKDVIESDKVFRNASVPMEEVRGLLDKPLNASVMAQWMRLGEWLPEEKTWEGRPGFVPGILEKNVRSILREKKDPQLVATWDLEMQLVADRITNARGEYKEDEFNQVTRPRLQFKQALDMIVVGQPNRALTQMIALIRTSPAHPDFPTWVAKIRERVKPPAPPASAAPAPVEPEASATPAS